MVTENLADSSVEVFHHLSYKQVQHFRYNIQILGKDLLSKQFLKIIDGGLTIEESHIFNNITDISSYPWDLPILKECVILRISWSLNEVDDKLALVAGVITSCKVLSLEIGVRWNAKNTLKWFAFS